MGIDIVTWKESMVFALLGRSLAVIQTLHHAYLVMALFTGKHIVCV